jgi:hypothetical protein
MAKGNRVPAGSFQNDFAFIRVLWSSQEGIEAEQYGYESHGTQKQESLCWREPAAVYLNLN